MLWLSFSLEWIKKLVKVDGKMEGFTVDIGQSWVEKKLSEAEKDLKVVGNFTFQRITMLNMQ